MNTPTKVLGGFILGATLGLATGLLIAPTSGNQTRKKLMKKSKGYSRQAVEAVRQYLENLKTGYGSRLDALTSKVDALTGEEKKSIDQPQQRAKV